MKIPKMSRRFFRQRQLSFSSYFPQTKEKCALMFHGTSGPNLIDVQENTAVEIVRLLNRRSSELPIITFDDAYAEIEDLVNRISDLGNTIKIFVPTLWVGNELGGKQVASWPQIRDWAVIPNVEIFSHGHSHTNMTRLSVKDLNEELRISRILVEENIQKSCTEIAYPRGKFNATVVETALLAGYKTGWTTDKGILSEKANSLSSPRIAIYNHSTPRTVLGETAVVNLLLQKVLKIGSQTK